MNKSILTALMDEMDAIAKANRPGNGNRWIGAIATVVLACLGAGAAYFLLGPSRRGRLQRRIVSVSRTSARRLKRGIASVSRTSVRRVKSGLADIGVLHPRRSRSSSSNGASRSRSRRRSRAGVR